MDIQQRRDLLTTRRNPDSSVDYVASMGGHMTIGDEVAHSDVMLRYVPDKVILEPASFGAYLDVLGTFDWECLEDAATTILNDINNELIARWVQVSVTAPDQSHAGVDSHEVLLEDHQPKWENPGLLSRLKLR